MRGSIAAIMLTLLADCTHTEESSITSAAADIFVMRHLQAGSGDDPSLTAAGAVVSLFFRRDPPVAIYASTFRRAQETAVPLAHKFGLPVKSYDPRDTPALIVAVPQESPSVLIMDHKNTVPDIVEALSGTKPDPIDLNEHGDIWRVRGGYGEMTKLHLEKG